jgi:hypothetical protein
MNLDPRIYELKSAIATACNLPTFLQLAPPNVRTPYAVLEFQSAEQVQSGTKTTNWQASFLVSINSTSDTECIRALDSVVSELDRKKSAQWYFCRVGTVNVSANYLDKAALWAATVSLTVQWTIPE